MLGWEAISIKVIGLTRPGFETVRFESPYLQKQRWTLYSFGHPAWSTWIEIFTAGSTTLKTRMLCMSQIAANMGSSRTALKWARAGGWASFPGHPIITVISGLFLNDIPPSIIKILY